MTSLTGTKSSCSPLKLIARKYRTDHQMFDRLLSSFFDQKSCKSETWIRRWRWRRATTYFSRQWLRGNDWWIFTFLSIYLSSIVLKAARCGKNKLYIWNVDIKIYGMVWFFSQKWTKMTFLYPLLKIHRKVEIKCSVENTFKNAGLSRPCFQGGFNIVVVHDKNQKIWNFK